MKKIKNKTLLCGGYEYLKVIKVDINSKKYDIENNIYIKETFFYNSCILKENLIIPNVAYNEINLVKFYNNNEVNLKKFLISSFLNIENKDNYVINSIIKLNKPNNEIKFVISMTHCDTSDIAEEIETEKDEPKKENANIKKFSSGNILQDLLLFFTYNKDKNKNIILDEKLNLFTLLKDENNIIEIPSRELLLCRLNYDNIAVVNTRNYKIEDAISLGYGNNFISSSLALYFCSFSSKNSIKELLFSIDKTGNIYQWLFDFDNKKRPKIIDKISLKYLDTNNQIKDCQDIIVTKALLFQNNKSFVILTKNNEIIICSGEMN